MKHNLIDKLMLILVILAIGTLVLLNLFQPQRPTYSETENRNLATMPEFSIGSLLDGSYFSDVATYFSDTFYQRDRLVSLSKYMDRLKGFSLFGQAEDNFVVIPDANATLPPNTEGDLPTLPTLPTLPPLTAPTTRPTMPTEPTFPVGPTVPTEPTNPTQPTNPTGPTGPANPTEPTEPTQPTPPTTQPPVPVTPLILSADSLSITAGASQALTAIVGEGYTDLTWHSNDASIATVTAVSPDTATVTAVAPGEAAISATVTGPDGQKTSLLCLVTVTEPVIEKPDDSQQADFLPQGIFLYKGAAYSQSYFCGKNLATAYANVFERYAQLFPDAQVSLVMPPMATITITDPAITSKISDEGAVLDKMEGYMPDCVNFVNLKDILRSHADEYLYFKSDHHWTHRGAYYAYHEFAKSVGLTPTDLNDFEVKILNTKYIGSMYSITGDVRVKSYYDTVEAYMPTKSCKMTIYGTAWGTLKRNYCIDTSYKNYLAFIMGDNGYTVINVPENDQSKSVLVIKDSFGNAFVPYLTEHYGNIYVLDPRHITMDVYEEFKDTGLTDIIFLINLQSSGNKAWYNYFYNAIV